MPVRWVVFDLNGTLVDPSVMAAAIGDSAADEELVMDAIDDAIAQAMVATLTGELTRFRDLFEAGMRRRLTLTGREPDLAGPALDLMGSMPAYLEAPAALERLRGEGLRLAVLSQSSADAASAVLRFAGLRDRVELVMSAQESGAYKPDPRPYRLALERMGADAGEVCFTAVHWWDVTGAKRVGMRTAWVARRERVLLESVPKPDVQGRDLSEVAEAIVAQLAG
jgi:2-haloacid dehalogenase